MKGVPNQTKKNLNIMIEELSIFYQISPSQESKNNFILFRMSFNHEEMFVWNASIWVHGPCWKEVTFWFCYGKNVNFLKSIICDWLKKSDTKINLFLVIIDLMASFRKALRSFGDIPEQFISMTRKGQKIWTNCLLSSSAIISYLVIFSVHLRSAI